jgi:hypothetical protein
VEVHPVIVVSTFGFIIRYDALYTCTGHLLRLEMYNLGPSAIILRTNSSQAVVEHLILRGRTPITVVARP